MIEPENIKRYTRELRSMVDHGANDPDAFAQVAALLIEARAQMHDSMAELRHNGYTDADIARALGISRQAVRQRWPHRRP